MALCVVTLVGGLVVVRGARANSGYSQLPLQIRGALNGLSLSLRHTGPPEMIFLLLSCCSFLTCCCRRRCDCVADDYDDDSADSQDDDDYGPEDSIDDASSLDADSPHHRKAGGGGKGGGGVEGRDSNPWEELAKEEGQGSCTSAGNK